LFGIFVHTETFHSLQKCTNCRESLQMEAKHLNTRPTV
jgi:hypothetical protein